MEGEPDCSPDLWVGYVDPEGRFYGLRTTLAGYAAVMGYIPVPAAA